MRNLKRALSLALAFVMVMSLMIVGTSAKSYTDADKIDNQVAVEILGEIGVMVGNDDGSFAPDRDVTRAEMAVILTRILYGNNMNVDQFKGLNTFTDVPDWAEGFVNLCASLDIIAGRGNGIFDPDATVTTAEAALMLSRALGYFKNNAEFGNDWALAAMKRATQAGIIGGDMVLAANEGLDRDDVAQMTFNTLTKAVPVQYNELLNVYYNVNQGIIYALEFNYLQTLGYTNFGLVYKTNEQTVYGRPATTWGIGSYKDTGSGTASGIEKAELTDEGGLIASNVRMLDKDQIITVANTPDYVYSQNTAEEDVYDDLGAALCNDAKGQKADEEYDWTVFINGEEQKLDEDDMIPAKNEDGKYAFTDKGTVTEIYVDDYDQTVTVVEINYYLGEVTKVDEEKGTSTIRPLSTEGKVLDERTYATTEFEKDDYVVFTVDFDDNDDFYICELMAPETVTGDVTRVQNNSNSKDNDKYNSYVRLNGEDTKYYYTNELTHLCYDVSEDGAQEHPTLNKEYIFYMTPAGYILGFAPTEVTVDQYLYVLDSDEDLRDWEAKVVLPDATQPKVALDEDLGNSSATTDYPFTFNGATGNIGTSIDWFRNNSNIVNVMDGVNTVASNELDLTNIDFLIWNYSVSSSDVYSLDYVTYWDGTGTEPDTYQSRMYNADIKNGKAYISEGNNDLIVDKQTIFVDTMNDVTYTGYSEVPNVEHATLAYVVEDKVAEIVFILNGDIYDANATYFMVTSSDRDSSEDGEAGEYWIYDDAYVNGGKTQLKITYDAVDKLEVSDPTAVDAFHALKTGILFKATKTIEDGEFIDEIEVVGTYNMGTDAYVADTDYNTYDGQQNNGTVNTVGDNAFWITTALSKSVKFDTDDETTYVTARYVKTLNGQGGYDTKWVIDDGDINDLKAIENDGNVTYSTKYVHVVSRVNDETARLVYIFWTEEQNMDSVAVNFEGIANADVKVNGTAFDAATKMVNKNSNVTVEIAADAGYTLTGVTLNGAAQTIKDGKCTISIKNITSAQDIVVTTEKNTAVKVNLFFEDAGLVTIGEDNYASNTQLTLVEGKTYVAQIAISGTTLEVRYNGIPLSPIGGNYVFVAEADATLVVNDSNNDASATTAVVATKAELDTALANANINTIYLGSGEYVMTTATNRITRGLTIIGSDNTEVYAPASSSANGFQIATNQDVTIKNITFKGDASLHNHGILTQHSAGKIMVENCVFDNLYSGIWLNDGEGTIKNCSFTYGGTQNAINIDGLSGDLTVEGCTFNGPAGLKNIFCASEALAGQVKGSGFTIGY